MFDARVKLLSGRKFNKSGKYILYWMQQSQRVEENHALIYAIEKANKYNLPVLVQFCLVDDYPQANLRHYTFMLEGLLEVKKRLNELNIKFIFSIGKIPEKIIELGKNASILVVDKGYLKIQKLWRKELCNSLEVPIVEVDTDLVVPIEIASDKEEYAAYTIRKKITRKLDDYLFPSTLPLPELSSLNLNIDTEKFNSVKGILEKINLDRSLEKSPYFTGGYTQAKERLENFIENKLDKYDTLGNNPDLDYTSTLSPYLHFGQISPVEIALAVRNSNKNKEGISVFLEELIVRRELAFNFCYYNENYDNYKGLKANWIYETLETHIGDKRLYTYTLEEFELAKTHDIIWNACQKELIKSGDMHGYMRMYWGKKILEWTDTPKKAFEYAIYLNNKYALDGRDANSFTGIAWCFGKHDRPWFERDIFGKVRYMNDNGLRRKFNVEKYIEKVNDL